MGLVCNFGVRRTLAALDTSVLGFCMAPAINTGVQQLYMAPAINTDVQQFYMAPAIKTGVLRCSAILNGTCN